MAIIALLHGPNLNLLGEREPQIYGSDTLDDYVAAATAAAAEHGHTVEPLQTNHEGVLVDAIHAARGRAAAIIINPGAFTHYAWSLHDALEIAAVPSVEVHLSDVANREEWRRTSVIADVCIGTVSGRGPDGYREALALLADHLGREEGEQ